MGGDKQETEELERRVERLRDLNDTWRHRCAISRFALAAVRGVWAAALLMAYRQSAAGLFRAVSLGGLMFFRPWAAWALRALDLDAGIPLDRPVLLLSGVTFGLKALDDFFNYRADVLYDRLLDAEDDADALSGEQR